MSVARGCCLDYNEPRSDLSPKHVPELFLDVNLSLTADPQQVLRKRSRIPQRFFSKPFMVQQETHFYEFGRFRLDATERVLLRDRELVPLTPKVFDILLALVEHGGHLVEKDDLMKRVWPD